ncbi:hypothetical protein BpHYR1_020364 [Brachionus plicatilis]|uniref:Uncharacterized protein n=1 Tax=Brachionus plicatilis TaxID=10195 RepID=A0A3M7SSN9_BRAPC|nr:hypothetical protein BpHYR1_020364 [Brachionus plicatilis]
MLKKLKPHIYISIVNWYFITWHYSTFSSKIQSFLQIVKSNYLTLKIKFLTHGYGEKRSDCYSSLDLSSDIFPRCMYDRYSNNFEFGRIAKNLIFNS